MRIVLALASLIVACAGPAPAAEKPNVLFIISDDLTACLGCYGNEVCQTPNLDQLAAEGVLFEHAYCQYPLCGPSRASLMSGLSPHTTKMKGNSKAEGAYKATNPKLKDHPSIGGFLRRHGYYSARISKIYHMGIPGGIEAGEPGGDDPASWDWTYNVLGPETYSPGKLELLTPKRPHWGSNFSRLILDNDRTATQTDVMAVTQAIALLWNREGSRPDVKTRDNRVKPESPFFLAVGLVRPHVPLIAPRRHFKKFPPSEMEMPKVPEEDFGDVPRPATRMRNDRRYGMNKEQQRKAISAYYASVSFMDEQVGRLLDALERLEIRDETIVIFTSDHGYNLGEHNCWQKVSLWEESAQVPLIISAPGFSETAGQTTEHLVELVDLYPTIADLVGLENKAPDILQGTSLRPLIANPNRDDWKKEYAHTMTRRHGESIRTPRWRYTSWGKAGEELYDHKNDPHEWTNLADNPEYTDVLKRMRKTLEEAREKSTRFQ